ncbi:MAG: type III-B CRISPR module RAMP protein Cmr1 [Paludibacteraceae bacterium]|nr:type III-B CRISPR module RAMP protein Cmr1 [Paludibacteraceae bacterium]
MKEYAVEIRSLTPIWTGNAQRESPTLRETGIIGSLRWWYEALIRGLGGYACDPTNTKCKEKEHCDACELFGCTGWARKFRLEVNFNHKIPEIQIGTRMSHKKKYLKRSVSGFMSNEPIILKFIPLRKITSNELTLLNATFKIIANYGAIGARISQGNGVIEIVKNSLANNDEKVDKSGLRKIISHTINSPNLEHFFFYKFHIKFKEDINNLIENKVFGTHSPKHKKFKDNWGHWETLWEDYHFLPIAFHIRDALRSLESNYNKRHTIFGEMGKGSKIFVSHGYKIDERTVEIRIWGHDLNDYLKENIKTNMEERINQMLFSKEENKLEFCDLKEEKSGKKLVEDLL